MTNPALPTAEAENHSPTRTNDRAAWLRKPRARRIEKVDLSEILGEPCVLYVRALTQREAAIWEAEALNKKLEPIPARVKNYRERLLLYTICDENGSTYLDKRDLDDLASMPSAAINTLFAKAKELSAIRDEEESKSLAEK